MSKFSKFSQCGGGGGGVSGIGEWGPGPGPTCHCQALPGLPRLPLSHSLAGKWVMFTTAAVQSPHEGTVYSGLYNECTYAT